jgi:N-acetyl-anhydromuramyl-L-alanine amidase AmpD
MRRMAKRTFNRPGGRTAYVRNRSGRRGAKPVRVVIHSTESHNRPGRGDVDSIHAYFDTSGVDASSHVIVDMEGHSTTCVPDSDKAWTQAAYNSDSLSIEFIGIAAGNEWALPGIKKGAKFTAYWCKKYDIPVRRSVAHGICGHIDLGQSGGGHSDPGPNFPWRRFLALTAYYRRFGWVA